MERLAYDYLFQRHQVDQIKRWINDLKYSYFKRAWGGHANDGDEFKLILNYKDEDDLLDILKRLGIKLNTIPKDSPKPIPGKPYSYDEYFVFKSEIKDFPEFEQPKHIEFNGIKCFCWIENGVISFSFSGAEGDSYEVTETDYENCKKLEKLIVDHGLTTKVGRRLEELVTVISQVRYKELFE